MAFRGFEVNEYEVAMQAAREIGWLEEAEAPDSYRLTSKGRDLREKVESQTDEYFFQPWSVLTPGEMDELYDLLVKFRDQLRELRKNAGDGTYQ
jgi:hypothetical protein